ncbi:MAG: GNAT family N-acetyltransferase [Paracoccaceae bacterium]
MEPHVATRKLQQDDHAAALVLYDVLLGAQPASLDPAAFHNVLQHQGTQVIGAFKHNHLRAMVTLHILPNVTLTGRPYALLENVATHPNYRAQGYAHAAMNHAIETAWASDCYKLMLLTGRNSDAKGFYEKLGFVADQKWGMQLRRMPVRAP